MDALDRFYMTAPLSLGLAVHEAGHAVGRWWCGLPLHIVAALPDGMGITARAAGRAPFDISQARDSHELHRFAVALYAGSIAEAMVTGLDSSQRWDHAVDDGARVNLAARRILCSDDVDNALRASSRYAVWVLDQPRVLAMVMAIVGLLVKQRVLRGDAVLRLLDDTIGRMYPWQQRDPVLGPAEP